MNAQPLQIEILGVPVDRVTMAGTVTSITALVSRPGVHQVTTVNPEFVMAAQQDPRFMEVLHQADLCLPDGIGLIWAARLLGKPLAERVPGSELVYHLAAACAREGWPLFLLGAAPGVAAEAGDRLAALYPGLRIAGTHAGSPAPAENEEIVDLINKSGAKLLLVAYGAPAQDLWIYRNREVLSAVRVALGVGGSLDFITGRAVRAPVWVQNLGLEWLHRLVREPWRWRRMLALPRFALAVLALRLRTKRISPP